MRLGQEVLATHPNGLKDLPVGASQDGQPGSFQEIEQVH